MGLGAEIGSTLLLMNSPETDGWAITHVLTRKPEHDSNYPDLGPVYHLLARLAIAEPASLGHVGVSDDGASLIVEGRAIEIIWGDVEDGDLSFIDQQFDLVILATSQKHVNTPHVLSRMEKLGRIVYCLAENPNLPAAYPVLQYPDIVGLDYSRSVPCDEMLGTYCAGSCQTHGWLGQVVPIVAFVTHEFGITSSDSLVRAEVDIVHPDTPTGTLGTHGFSARDQDARDNLRPSFSQLDGSMRRLWPHASGINTVSLRALVQPPGYQLCRTYLRMPREAANLLTWEGLAQWLEAFSVRFPLVTQVSKIPLGSRAFAQTSAAAVILLDRHHLRIADLSELVDGSSEHRLLQVLTQSYVHNSRGYCAGVRSAITRMLNKEQEIHIVVSQ